MSVVVVAGVVEGVSGRIDPAGSCLALPQKDREGGMGCNCSTAFYGECWSAAWHADFTCIGIAYFPPSKNVRGGEGGFVFLPVCLFSLRNRNISLVRVGLNGLLCLYWQPNSGSTLSYVRVNVYFANSKNQGPTACHSWVGLKTYAPPTTLAV